MTPTQLGKAIRKARGDRSIRDVSIASGLNRHQVTAIETAATNYTIGSLMALCKVLGVSININ